MVPSGLVSTDVHYPCIIVSLGNYVSRRSRPVPPWCIVQIFRIDFNSLSMRWKHSYQPIHSRSGARLPAQGAFPSATPLN